MASSAYAGDIVVQNFGGGLNSLDNAASIDPSQAQDLLNVNFQPGGTAVYKRDGYGLFQSLPISCSTCAVHGGYHFQQTTGNDVQLWGNDSELSASVNDASFVKIATGSVGATWQCADSQGYAYCLTSNNDQGIQTDGTTGGTSYQVGVPSGTMVTFTPLQMVVAGVPNNLSTLYVSQQNAFTNFTVGTLNQSAFTEPVAAPGSRITHIAYYFGKLFWWKDQSFGYATFTNQFDWQLTIVSNQIGTLDNSDAFWNSSGFDTGTKFSGTANANAEKSPGGIFFRGQDNHMYVYDGFYLTRLSRVISPTVSSANRRKANSWTQSSQSDFASGFAVNNGSGISVDTATFSGNVQNPVTVLDDSTTANFSLGTGVNTHISANTIGLTTNNSGNVDNASFENGSVATANQWTYTNSSHWTWLTSSALSSGCGGGTLNPVQGSRFVADSQPGCTPVSVAISLIDNNTGTQLDSQIISPGCSFAASTWTVNSAFIGHKVKVAFTYRTTCGADAITSNPFVLGGNISWYTAYDTSANGSPVYFDNVVGGSSTVNSASFTSRSVDTKWATTAITPTVFTTVNSSTGTTVTCDVQTAAGSNGPWTSLGNCSVNNYTGQEFVRYTTTFTVNTDALGTLNELSATITPSTGSYYSSVHNAPNLSSWGTFFVTDNSGGGATMSYFTRSSTNVFTLNSSTPSWVSQTKNANVSASTGTYFQARMDYTMASALNDPALNDFTFNWFEGSAADKAYLTYFNDAIWFSESAGSSSSTNNRIFYWDILNGAWTLYDISANGFLVENNTLYFGDPTQGRVFKYGSVTTDNGSSINSYWRSKTFLGQDPFVQNEFQQADFVLGESSGSVTYTYTLDSKTATAFNFTTYDSAASLIQRNFLLPVGKIGKYYDFKMSDNSGNAAWRLMAHKVHYNPLNWKPVLN